MHVISGDAGMSQMSTFLRVGTMSLLVEMLECQAIPNIPYDVSKAATDIQGVSIGREHWCLTGTRNKVQSALDILHVYLERAKKFFLHRDLVTDAILFIWEDTLTRLSKDPMGLWRRLDWVLKYHLLELWKSDKPSWTVEDLRSQDMEYHNLHPLHGLYYALHDQVEHVVSDELVRLACTEPPSDTRAFLRGKIVHHLAKEGHGRAVCTDGWSELMVVDGAYSDGRLPNASSLNESAPWCYAVHPIPNPCETYEHLIPEILKKLNVS